MISNTARKRRRLRRLPTSTAIDLPTFKKRESQALQRQLATVMLAVLGSLVDDLSFRKLHVTIQGAERILVRWLDVLKREGRRHEAKAD